jgi:3-hydroxy-3-methylglutaryl CoA synthase
MALVSQSQEKSGLRTKLQSQVKGISSSQSEYEGLDSEGSFVNRKEDIGCMAMNVAKQIRTRERDTQRH